MKVFDPIPNVVLLGETNVGKSSLFNKIVGERVSLVGDVRDLTRDVIVKTAISGNFNLVDLPGINKIEEINHYLDKLPSVNAFIIMIDNLGWRDRSERFLQFAMRSGKRVIVVVNKSDLPCKISKKNNLEVRNISVIRNHGVNELIGYLSSWFEDYNVKKTTSWGFVGRSNVGKSTLLNKLLGTDRFVVKDEIGTTQESNEITVEVKNRIFRMVDTPGYRKNNDISELEKASQYRLLESLNDKVDNFVVLIDITQGINKVDLMLMDKVWSAGKGLIVGIGMWDQVNNLTVLANAKKQLKMRFYDVNCIALSGVTGHGMNNLLHCMSELEQKMKQKVKTSSLNKYFASIKNTDMGTVPGIKYITQLGINPPTFGLFTSRDIPQPRLRFLEKKLADSSGLNGIHLNLIVKHKGIRDREKNKKR